MAKKVRTKERVATIFHPNDADIKLEVKRPGRLEKMRLLAKVRNELPVRAIRDGEALLYEDDGKTPLVHVSDMEEFPSEAIIHILESAYIEGTCKGILDEETDRSVDITRENLHLLLNEELDVVPEKGPSYPFWMYIFRCVMDPETFKADPKASR